MDKTESKKVLIIGGEGHGSIIASCIKDNRKRYNDLEWEVAGFLNDFVSSNIGNYPVLGNTSQIKEFSEKGFYFAWGIHLIAKNKQTHDAFIRMNIPEERLATIIHRSAFIAEDVVLSPGVLVMPNVYIANRTKIGLATMIKSNVCIGHDVESAMLCHFAMHSTTGSFSKLGVCSDVAIGATVLEYVNIGNYAMAGAGSLVSKNIPDYEIHIGSPAKFLKKTQK